jgi:hypothetical protein
VAGVNGVLGWALLAGWLGLWAALPMRWGKGWRTDLRLPLGWAAVIILAGAFPRYAGNPEALATTIWVQRYMHLGTLVTMWLVLEQGRRGTGWRRQSLAVGAAVLLGVTRAQDFRLTSWPDFGWADRVRAVAPGETVVVPVNPPGWMVEYRAKEE